MLVDKVNDSDRPLPPPTFDRLIESVHQSMDDYYKSVDTEKHEYNASDKKKLLSLPFNMAKRSEKCAPK
jgi:hypothetical protein